MPKAWAIDLSRLASRISVEQLTGIDRVELAWARFLSAANEPLFGLIRTKRAFWILDRAGVDRVIGLLSSKSQVSRINLENELRQIAIAQATKLGLGRAVRRHFPEGVAYLNLGHSNVSSRVFRALKSIPGTSIFVFVHDAIPLSYPSFQTGAANRKLRRILKVSMKFADGLIFSTQTAMDDVKLHATIPERIAHVVSPLGSGLSEKPILDPILPAYFVMLGTIEPRKNHDLIFEVWDRFIKYPPAGGIPKLVVIGRRGWAAPEVFSKLDALIESGHVEAFENATDGDVSNILAKSHGHLFPSFAEGFGIPVLEATELGIPTLCSHLPSVQEVFGDIPTYLPPDDVQRWRDSILNLVLKEKRQAEQKRITEMVAKQALPTWDTHFNRVLRMIG